MAPQLFVTLYFTPGTIGKTLMHLQSELESTPSPVLAWFPGWPHLSPGRQTEPGSQ
jgi:hypothetical protein